MLALFALLGSVAHLAAASPPTAFVDTGSTHVPLGITSWCWDNRCGAPLGSTGRRVVVSRGAAVRVELKFDEITATVNVGGAPVAAATHAREVAWKATRGGGLTVYVKYPRGWVIYTARLALR